MFDAIKRITLTTRVEHGVKWLDGFFGRNGWLPSIDGEILNIRNGDTCVIGQLFPQTATHLRNNFNNMVEKRLMPISSFQRRGFELPESSLIPWRPTVEDYALLTDIWLEKIGELNTPKPIISPIQREDLTIKPTTHVRQK